MYRNKSTIRNIIDNGLEEKITSSSLSLKTVITNSSGEMFIVNMFNLYEKYYEILLDDVVTATLSEEEYNKYRFNPRLLSFDLYGTQELHYMLLRLNHVYSVINFDFTEVRVFKPTIISKINEIMVLESEEYIDNEVSILKKINE
jgi:hypothetical protein